MTHRAKRGRTGLLGVLTLLGAALFSSSCGSGGASTGGPPPASRGTTPPNATPTPLNASVSVASEQIGTIPAGVRYLPDEHSSMLPPSSSNAQPLFFEAGEYGTELGAIVLTSTDNEHYSFAPGYASPVFGPPANGKSCPPGRASEWDENYAAPTSVLQDPTLPAGNLIMIYEGENLCHNGTYVLAPYATAGLARSSDNGVTWPSPTVSPTAKRFPIVSGPDPEPTSLKAGGAVGDAVPSAYIEMPYIYVPYTHHPGPGSTQHPSAIQMARAQLGGDGTLTFYKYVRAGSGGNFTAPGLGGKGSDLIQFGAPGTCVDFQRQPDLSYNEALQRYLLVMVCSVSGQTHQFAWYFSTATSLTLEDWSVPKLVENSARNATQCPVGNGPLGFDGWYPTFVSVGMPVGHTGANGTAFYSSGCLFGTHTFNTRAFKVSASS